MRLTYALLGFFSFTRCVPTLWIFDFTGLLSMYNLDSLSRVPFLRVLLMVQYRQLFQTGFQNGPENFQSFLRELACLIHLSSRRSTILSLGWYFRTALVWRFLWTFVQPLVPCFQGGSLKFLDGLICKCKRCLGNPSICILFLYFCDKYGPNWLYLILSGGISFAAVFTHVLWEGDN